MDPSEILAIHASAVARRAKEAAAKSQRSAAPRSSAAASTSAAGIAENPVLLLGGRERTPTEQSSAKMMNKIRALLPGRSTERRNAAEILKIECRELKARLDEEALPAAVEAQLSDRPPPQSGSVV